MDSWKIGLAPASPYVMPCSIFLAAGSNNTYQRCKPGIAVEIIIELLKAMKKPFSFMFYRLEDLDPSEPWDQLLHLVSNATIDVLPPMFLFSSRRQKIVDMLPEMAIIDTATLVAVHPTYSICNSARDDTNSSRYYALTLVAIYVVVLITFGLVLLAEEQMCTVCKTFQPARLNDLLYRIPFGQRNLVKNREFFIKPVGITVWSMLSLLCVRLSKATLTQLTIPCDYQHLFNKHQTIKDAVTRQSYKFVASAAYNSETARYYMPTWINAYTMLPTFREVFEFVDSNEKSMSFVTRLEGLWWGQAPRGKVLYPHITFSTLHYPVILYPFVKKLDSLMRLKLLSRYRQIAETGINIAITKRYIMDRPGKVHHKRPPFENLLLFAQGYGGLVILSSVILVIEIIVSILGKP